MKNLTKIFMAVVAGMFAFSCVTDTTEDLGVKVGGHDGVTTLTISMPEVTKTHLGEKAGDLYPLYWSEGDAISVNGVTSTPLTADQADKNSAVFTFGEDLKLPYCVVYPAAASRTEGEATEGEDVEEPETPADTAYPVNFLAEQPYTVGTFAPAAAPMCGYLAEAGKIEMQHLTGVLRLAIAGNGEKVTSIKIKAEKGKIAGAFTVDCTTGVLTPADDAVGTTTVTFTEPLTLGTEAQVVYVTVPAGSHGTFLVTINTEAHEKMTVKFDSDAKPINAGSVREFEAFTYEANNNDAEGVFEIDSEEALIEFARIAGTFYPRTKAVVTANITITKPWTPIEGFGAFEFDGGSEEGCYIKGLNAPLFGTTAANIKNLNLVDVNISETTRLHVGAIACDLHGTLENCQATGSVIYNNTTFNDAEAIAADKNLSGVIDIAGLVGMAHNATLKDCVNRVNVTVNSVCATELEVYPYVAVGGAVGGAHTQTAFNNVDNYGTVSVAFKNTCITDVGGVLGRVVEYKRVLPDILSVEGCDNHGKIQSTADFNTTNQLIMGGVLSRIGSYTDPFNNNHNHGEVVHNGTTTGTLMLGGVVGQKPWSSFTSCSNEGTIHNEGTAGNTNLGGICGDEVSSASLTNCSNTGTVYNNGTTAKLKIGGISAGGTRNASSTLTSCTNEGALYNSGTCTKLQIGGILGATPKSTLTSCSNSGDIYNSSDIADITTNFGGIIGESLSGDENISVISCENTGNIYNTATVGNLYMGGIVSYGGYNTLENCTNGADSKIYSSGTSSLTYLGGIVGFRTTVSASNCDNHGELEVSGTVSGVLYMGGISGSLSADSVENCDNTGSITVTAAAVCKNAAHIGGLFGRYVDNENSTNRLIKTCTNSGQIEVKGTFDKANSSYDVMVSIGGLGGSSATYEQFESCTNSGAINAALTDQTSYLLVGGLLGSNVTTHAPAQPTSFNTCYNDGVVTVVTPGANVGSNFYVGGLIGFSSSSAANYPTKGVNMDTCANRASLNVSGAINSKQCKFGGLIGGYGLSTGTAENPIEMNTFTNCSTTKKSIKGTDNKVSIAITVSDDAHMGGLIGTLSGPGVTFTNCENGMDIVFDITATTAATGDFSLGGFSGYSSPAQQNYESCTNSANITFKGNVRGGLYLGGHVGYANDKTRENSLVLNNCINSGHIKCEGTSETSYVCIAGIVSRSKSTTLNGCVNKGTVETTNTSSSKNSTFVGGVMGWDADCPSTIVDCWNTGEIKSNTSKILNGSSSTWYYNTLTVGGIIAGGTATSKTGYKDANGTAVTITGGYENCVNTGNITVALNENIFAHAIGGVVGKVAKPLTGCKSYCDLKALDATNIGMIMGIARADATLASGCGVGGNLILTQDATGEMDPDTMLPIVGDKKTEITGSNYLQYVYGGGSVAASDAEASFLTEKPVLTE